MKRHRATAARNRDRNEVASVALVGYTNAGKSTLLNALADADVYVADMLFATLDPTSRQVSLPTGQQVVITDTVGFINKLPHDLVDAFRATLEEVMRADLLLEVVDAADPDFVGQQAAVQTVLDELGAGDKPRITVFNKIDLLPGRCRRRRPTRPRRLRERGDRRRARRCCASGSPISLRGQMVAGRRGRAVRARRARCAGAQLGRRRGALRGARRPRQRPPARRRSPPSSPRAGRTARRRSAARADRAHAPLPGLREELLDMTARELAAADAFFARTAAEPSLERELDDASPDRRPR